jgi:hemerythrin
MVLSLPLTQAAKKEQVQKMLDFLGEYVVQHFHDEEELQKQSNYPGYEWHRQQHQDFIATFQKASEEFAKNGATPTFTLQLNSTIIHWVVRHIKTSDLAFGEYYKKHNK